MALTLLLLDSFHGDIFPLLLVDLTPYADDFFSGPLEKKGLESLGSDYIWYVLIRTSLKKYLFDLKINSMMKLIGFSTLKI